MWTLYSLVEIFWWFERTFCLYLQGGIFSNHGCDDGGVTRKIADVPAMFVKWDRQVVYQKGWNFSDAKLIKKKQSLVWDLISRLWFQGLQTPVVFPVGTCKSGSSIDFVTQFRPYKSLMYSRISHRVMYYFFVTQQIDHLVAASETQIGTRYDMLVMLYFCILNRMHPVVCIY
jgi:hypothetical protein